MKNKGYKIINFDSIFLIFLLVVLVLEPFDISFIKFSQYFLQVIAIIATIPVIFSAYRSVLSKKVSVDLLASIALVFSLLSHEWLSAIFINLMLTSARIFLSYNEAKARKNIESLLKLKPKKVKVKREESIIEIDLKDVIVGDIVIVDLGERIPIDGRVISGEASIDESSLTGESIPINKTEGDQVLSSTLVVSGNLIVETVKIGAETTLEKIIKLVEEAEIDKPDIHTTAEKFATWYLITVFIGSIVAYFISYDLTLVLAIMLVVCADDVAVAVPLTFLTAISYLR